MSTTKSEEINFIRREEFAIGAAELRAVKKLLRSAFPGFPDRTFYRQLPDFRLLGYADEQLMAHMAVEHRLINNAGQLLEVFGVMDLCVDALFQRRRIASRMLEQLADLGRSHQVDFLVLLASQHQLYLEHGFRLVQHPCVWMMISGDQTLGVARRSVNTSLMVKSLGKREWEDGLVDFLGPIF